MVVVKAKTGAAIQAAIDKAAKGKAPQNRMVLLPSGDFSVETKAIYLKKGVRIIGVD
jgi:hypothetical protein